MKTRDIVISICETILKVAIIAVIVMFIYRGALLAYDYGYRIFEEAPMSEGEGREVVITISEGMSAQEMGELLFKKGLIRDEKLFRIQYVLSEYKEELLPGTFTLRTNMTVEEMLKAMTVSPDEEE
ncbi:MAG: endolytic transglycosylase MltG [Lachnospiraceae bacterium]|nr:endolytic transglycosylase MltG [Lachnospiraceae bacterium]